MLPPPDYLITSVGTKVASCQCSGYKNLLVLRHCKTLPPAGREQEGVAAVTPAVVLSACRCTPRHPLVVPQVYTCVDGEWVVDADHVAMLDDAWDLDVVREATYAALAAVGRENMHFRPPDEQNEHKASGSTP